MKEDFEIEVGKHSSKLETAVVKERDLLSAVSKNTVDSRRAAWCVITSIEQKEKSKSEEQLASYAREYIAKVEVSELQKIREASLLSWTRSSSHRLALMSRRRFTTR